MKCINLISALLCFSASLSQIVPKPGIDSLFQSCNNHTPGFAIAVVKNGKIDYMNGYGIANLEYNTPITPSTVFHLASVSKQFTAFCIYQLAGEGLLNLDDNIKKYLPELNDYQSPITIRHLLNHVSGIRDEVELLGLSGIFEPDAVSLQNTLDIITRQKELNFTPGDKWLYSNSGYILLAEIIARVSGKPFPDFIQQKVFSPLGMEHSFINNNAQHVVPFHASSYEKDAAGNYLKKELNYSYYGATNMNSTVEDLAKWLINLGSNTLGDAAIPNKMAERAVLNNGDTAAYASGFFVGKSRGYTRIFHDGNDAGFETFIEYFPAQNIGIAVLSNQLNSNPAGKAAQIASLYLSPNVTSTVNKNNSTYLYVKTNQSYLAAYTGNYETGGGNLIKIYAQDTSLIIKFPDDGPQSLKALNDTVFKVFDDMLITFTQKSQGTFSQIKLKSSSFFNTAARVEYVDYTSNELKAFTGTYFSDELQTSYEIKIIDGHLAMYNIMNGSIPLNAKTRDRFAADQWYAKRVVFARDASQNVISFRVSSDRVKNLLFTRIR